MQGRISRAGTFATMILRTFNWLVYWDKEKLWDFIRIAILVKPHPPTLPALYIPKDNIRFVFYPSVKSDGPGLSCYETVPIDLCHSVKTKQLKRRKYGFSVEEPSEEKSLHSLHCICRLSFTSPLKTWIVETEGTDNGWIKLGMCSGLERRCIVGIERYIYRPDLNLYINWDKTKERIRSMNTRTTTNILISMTV